MAESSRDDRFVQRLNFSSENLALNWKTFKSQFAIYKVAKKLTELTAEEQVANLLLLMGSDSVPIYDQFIFGTDNPKTLANVIAMFDRHFEPVKNLIFERVKFNSMCQNESGIHQFITDVQTQADNCDYGTMRDQLVRDRIVVGINDSKLREYLIDTEDLDLAKCIQRAKQYTSHHDQIKKMTAKEDNIDYVSTKSDSSKRDRAHRYDNNRDRTYRYDSNPRPNLQVDQGRQSKCPYCNKTLHSRERCPARRSICHVCKRRGHWSVVCKTKSPNTHELVEDDTDLEGLFLGSD